VVLEMDWLPLSAPLLCTRLGYCDEQVQQTLSAAKRSSCGINATLAGLDEEEREEVLGLLTRRNALDLELYSFARELVPCSLLLSHGLKASCAQACTHQHAFLHQLRLRSSWSSTPSGKE
jgi:hypothetical protein